MSKLPLNTTDKWMREGLLAHTAFVEAFRKSKEHAINAGVAFYRARESFKTGDFGDYLATQEDKISCRTVYRYIDFVEEVVAWATHEWPEVKTNFDKAITLGRKMVMQSPKGYIGLCRQLELMRKFGEYDEVKYAKQKGQIEFDFSVGYKALSAVERTFKQWTKAPITPEVITEIDAHIAKLNMLVAELRAKAGAINVTPAQAALPAPASETADEVIDASAEPKLDYWCAWVNRDDEASIKIGHARPDFLAKLRADARVIWICEDIVGADETEALAEAELRREQGLGEITWSGQNPTED